MLTFKHVRHLLSPERETVYINGRENDPAMTDETPKPECFGSLENVFPMGGEGLRDTPVVCRACVFKTECLREAMETREGLDVKEEKVDRAYSVGMMGFFERWSRKKTLSRQKAEKTRGKG
jgi:hypothetical protein